MLKFLSSNRKIHLNIQASMNFQSNVRCRNATHSADVIKIEFDTKKVKEKIARCAKDSERKCNFVAIFVTCIRY